MKTKWILIVLKALIQCIFDSMKEMEKSGDVDADGVPFSKEYDKQGFILAKLREIISDVELNCESYEK